MEDEMKEETIKMRGDVNITIIDSDGNKEIQEYKNLIVNGGKTAMAKLLGGDSGYATDQISKIAYGTGSTAATTGDTALGASVLVKTATVTYPAFNKVMFSATMGTSEGGSNTFQELGLLTNNHSYLFSRLIISPITKSAAYQIQVDWTISFQ
jgi:hypothetical protein